VRGSLVTSDEGTRMNILFFSAHYAGRFLALMVCIVTDTWILIAITTGLPRLYM
jgi:hypothetical protein